MSLLVLFEVKYSEVSRKFLFTTDQASLDVLEGHTITLPCGLFDRLWYPEHTFASEDFEIVEIGDDPKLRALAEKVGDQSFDPVAHFDECLSDHIECYGGNPKFSYGDIAIALRGEMGCPGDVLCAHCKKELDSFFSNPDHKAE